MPLNLSPRPAFVAYLTCGDPDLATTRAAALAAIDAGAAVIELGVPFSDPVADGPVIQRASHRALERGTTLGDVLRLARELRHDRPAAGLIVFSYFNPVLRFGLERFCKAAARAGVDGALITDLTVEEAGDYLRQMRSRNLATVFLAAPTSSDARLHRIAKASTGFVYAVSRTGVTGARRSLSGAARQLVARLRRYTDLPIAVGFGISTPKQFRAVGRFADAVVVGSSIVERVERSHSPESASRAVGGWVRSLLRTPAEFAQRRRGI
ncbi:MAG TPA: tryptophan synthase subunit alpha [Terriglobales bacterium]|nr:tryptophan synthase subunit alpha [Terriglobales bacterium]